MSLFVHRIDMMNLHPETIRYGICSRPEDLPITLGRLGFPLKESYHYFMLLEGEITIC